MIGLSPIGPSLRPNPGPTSTSWQKENPDGVLFASSSAVAGFLERLGETNSKKILKETLCLSIGRKTTATLRDHGAARIAEASTSDFEGLLDLTLNELRVE